MAQAPKKQAQDPQTAQLRQDANRYLIEMKAERLTYMERWREITHYVLPTRGRYFNLTNQQQRGKKKWGPIVDLTGTTALGNLAAFMMAGITSPARQWFKLSTNSDSANNNPEVKDWLDTAQSRLERVLASGNFYSTAQQIYEEIAAFGTGACIILEDYDDVVRFYPLTAGEYYVAMNDRGEIDTLFREYVANVAQIVRKFGLENCSDTIRGLWESKSYTKELQLVHAIMPNSVVQRGAFGWRGAPWIGVYYEYTDSESVLKVESYQKKPFICPRWTAVSNDAYGNGPAEQALPDIKSLQVAQMGASEAIDRMIRPPMVAPASMESSVLSLTPNGLSFVPGLEGNPNGATIRPIYQINPPVNYLQERIESIRQQIRTTFKNDLILMVSQQESTQPVTAAEINAKQQEKLLALGPVLERFHNEALDPVIVTTLDIMERGGLLPPRPEVLRGASLKISYVSVLAQAQRATDTASIEQFMRFIGSQAALSPDVMDVVDTDAAAEEYGDLIGINPQILRTPDQVAQIRQQKQYAAQQQAAAEQAQQLAAGAKNLSQTDLGGGMNALQAITGGGV